MLLSYRIVLSFNKYLQVFVDELWPYKLNYTHKKPFAHIEIAVQSQMSVTTVSSPKFLIPFVF